MLDNITGIAYLLVILSVLVIAHELGHFLVAKLFKMRVEEFSLFFGSPLVRLGKRGDTEYNIRAFPLGGFVRIAGMDPDDISGGRPILEALRHSPTDEPDGMEKIIRRLDSDTMAGIDAASVSAEMRQIISSSIGPDGQLTAGGRQDLQAKLHSPQITTDEHKLITMVLNADARATDPGLYNRKPIWQRALVIFAGPFASLFFGFLLFCALGMTFGLPSDRVTNQVQVMPYIGDKSDVPSPAKRAGLQTGDRIVAINGKPTPDGKALADMIHKNPNVPLRLIVEREGRSLSLWVTPQPDKVIYEKGGRKVTETWGFLGVRPAPVFERSNLVASVVTGMRITGDYVVTLLHIFTDKQKLKDNVGGPIAMGQAAIAWQRLGLPYLVSMAAALSLSLGIMNLLPIPILDGGHLLLLAVEKVRRRKLSPREIYRAQMVGFGLLILIVCLVMYNDILRTVTGQAFQ
jgi:regulator of sigma E protease